MTNNNDAIAEIPEEVPAGVPADDFARADGDIYGAHWHVFIPTLVVTVLYFFGWLLLLLLGRGEGTLAKLFVLVLAVGVPLLTIHAFLRFNTTRVQMCNAFIRYHPGWPKRFLVDLPYALVEKVSIRRGISGRIFGGGTLVMHLTIGEKVYVPDLSDPEGACEAARAALAKSAA
ncbi:MAG: PH domain-containing protein [Rhizobiaceae bacterium]|nr:PH domain-containing protein [Rhizobiaceae bacterium]